MLLLRVIITCCLLIPTLAVGQPVATWKAEWIAHPNADPLNHGVFHFRKEIALNQKPEQFRVHISADNQYRLYVNGVFAATGPAAGDPDNWFYDTIDLAPYLQEGRNTLAALVWNFGPERGWNRMSVRTAFLLEGADEIAAVVNTGTEWKVLNSRAFFPQKPVQAETFYFIVTGSTDSVATAYLPNGWQENGYADQEWDNAASIARPLSRGDGSGTNWSLTPRTIPMLERKQQRFASVRRSTLQVPKTFLEGKTPFTIPPFTNASILFDQQHLTNAYPTLRISGGKGGKVVLSYAEALMDEHAQKGSRNDIEGKKLVGNKDVYMTDGREHILQPLEYRTYRYLQIDIRTEAEALQISDFHGVFTGYPFEEKASFSANDPALAPIWEVGWRTARLCAMDTYMDCPYYERLQYVGDTRIQALISLYVSGDDRLMKHAISLLNSSRFGDGLTRSRYPSWLPQVIPTFSLFWIDMLYDYYQHRPDAAFLKPMLPGMQNVLDWYAAHLDSTGLLGPVPYWNFVDWTAEWPWDNQLHIGGVPEGVREGGSAIVSLQFAYTLRHAAALYEGFGETAKAQTCMALAGQITQAVANHCWNPERQLFADTPGGKSFSQHANIFAVLTDALPPGQQADLMQRTDSDPSLIQSSYYFRFYLWRAMKKAGLADRYLEGLGPWKEALRLGLTTFPETGEPTRSDCHAWSASPNYDLLATVCGITPGSPGFQSVHIAPHPGRLMRLSGKMPHPSGETIGLEMKQEKNGSFVVEIRLPEGIPGEFVWRGKTWNLTQPYTRLVVPAQP